MDALNVQIKPVDYPISILSNWHMLARELHKRAPVTRTVALQPKFAPQSRVATNKQLAIHFPWTIGETDFSQLYATGPVSGPNVATWGLLNSKVL